MIKRKKQPGNVKYWNLTDTYVIKDLIDHNVSEIQKMNKLEKHKNIPNLIQKIVEWSYTSPEEAIGVLEIIKNHFIHLAESQ